MKKIFIIIPLVREYGIMWLLYRILYSTKLILLNIFPFLEIIFEKKVLVQKINIYSFNKKEISRFLRNIPIKYKVIIIDSADLAISGKITAFSSLNLDYGDPIQWQLNPISGEKTNANEKWFKISDFDSKRGDIKLIWEISRFSHFYLYIRAYILTGDRKYYKAFSTQLNDWVEQNKYSFGANFKCGQEASLRMINVLIAYSAFSSYGLVNEEDYANVVSVLTSSYKKVQSNFFYAHKCIINNHTISELAALIIGAKITNNDKKLKKAYRLFDKEIIRQFSKDGGYIQKSFNYQRFALDIISFIISITEENQGISTESKNRVVKSARMLFQVQNKNGVVPNYGSNDGSLVFPLSCCEYNDFRPTINSIMLLLENRKMYENGLYDESFLWINAKDIKKHQYMEKYKKISKSYNDAGIYSMRDKNIHVVIIHNKYKNRPAHMDQHHIDVWINDLNIFGDCGTYSYASEIGRKMILNSSHNSLQVDKSNQMSYIPPFLIYNWTKSIFVKHSKNDFIGIIKVKIGYKHKREIRVENNEIKIVDEVSGYGENAYLYFHTKFKVEITDYGFNLLLSNHVIVKVKTKHKINVEKGYCSSHYLKKNEINKIVISNKIINNFAEFNIKIIQA